MNKHSIEERALLNNLKQILKIMRITLFLLFFCTLFSSAESIYSQVFTMKLKTASIKEVCKEIEKGSDYVFVFSDNSEKLIDMKVNVETNKKNVAEVLDAVLSNTGLTYQILDKQIIVYKSAEVALSKIIEQSVVDIIQQPAKKQITGKVSDAQGEPVIGANIVEAGTTNGTITDVEGKYSINVEDNAIIQVSYIGYLSQSINTSRRTNINITLLEDTQALDELVVVGYGTQKRATLTGAVAAVTGEDITKSKNENIQNMLTGRISGLRVVQNSSEPGAFNTELNIRGMGTPLVVIDGVPRENIERLDAYDVESISVLKDASAAVYGVRAANGVILVTTKKGSNVDSKPSLNFNSNYTWQYTSGLPKTVDAIDFLIMSNEKGMNNSMGGVWTYPQEQIDAYYSGELKSTDWWNEVIKEGAPQITNNLNVSGGTERTKYYFSLGNLYQDSFFRSNDYWYKRYNLRSNISTKITNDLTMSVNLNGIMDERNASSVSASNVIYAMWRQYPIATVYANNNDKYFMRPDNKDNPVQTSRISEVGYNSNNKKWFQSTVALDYRASFLTGLSAKAQFSYDYDQTTYKNYQKAYPFYEYNINEDKYISMFMNLPTNLTRDFVENLSMLYQLSLNYQNTFLSGHNVNAILLAEGVRKEGDGFFAKREFSIDVDELFAGNQDNQVGSQNAPDRYEYATMSYIGRLNYDYNGKYMIEGSFRYDGSSKFPSSKRWGIFPAFSAGYRISEEAFWKNNESLSNISNFKLRASYGVLGDDKALDYQFISGYNYPAYALDHRGRQIPGGYFFDGIYINGIQSTGIPNHSITWYKAIIKNIGLDFGLWRGLLGGSLEIFSRDRTGLLATSNTVLPGTVGAELPQENLNSDQAIGFEFELFHNNHFGDLFYKIQSNMSVARTKVIYRKQSEYRNSYLNWLNNTTDRYTNIWFGYSSGGQFENWQEIAEFPISTSRKLPGDYYYKDWNGDGFINSLDIHPIGFDSKPLLNFGTDIYVAYKGFDLSCLFQGAAMTNVEYTGILQEPFWGFQSAPISMFTDRWRPVDPLADPYNEMTEWEEGKYPMMGSATPIDGSETNMENGSYVRLKNLEIGYTLSKNNALSRVGLKNIRIYVNAYNLLTFSQLNYVDPEHPSSNEYMYPLNRSISLGINLNF
ncbi:MAG TPA: SusC/RagA family TonB-linked outer membrane protein [Porphyromonadaceae bacterium]|jgi:TonB-linked SusC/RagA family outer membrane protein|uniref:SusC/RagA family TonB-linked outer membrane protein n=1 Tax=Proteiniphilum sp. UBA5510 TaxID=1947286 RepID=UPI000E96A3E7|nr:SusC/RagA family TonB-linked outer membrane protein [Proteiniphilum sp. UBA5510]HBT84740.1 SusC/RagA family TonB-linked outer membrane protein [Porphyromonadaceae bacterium]